MSNELPSTRNITRLFRTATVAEIREHAQWYSTARSIAEAMGIVYSVSTEQAAGVIAATSPLNSWGANVKLAERVLAAGGLTAGYLSTGLAKADRILAGEDIETVLNGLKTVNFYRSIVTAGITGICIDRHAWSLAVNVRYADDSMPGLTGKRYAAAVDAYTRAARILSREYEAELTPAMVQSVTWMLWRRKFWSEGAWDQGVLELTPALISQLQLAPAREQIKVGFQPA